MRRLLILFLCLILSIVVFGNVNLITEHQEKSSPPGDLHVLQTSNKELDLISSKQLEKHHPQDRSYVHLGLDSDVENCYQDKDVHVVVTYSFNDIDPSLFDHELILRLKNSFFNTLIEQQYLLNEMNLVVIPVDEFQVGGEKAVLSLIDNTTNTIIDERMLRFINPCFHRPTILQQYVLIPLSDNPGAVLLGGLVVAAKAAIDHFFKTVPPPNTLTVLPQDSPHTPSQGGDDHPFKLMKRYVSRLTTRANPVMSVTYPPSPKLLTNPPVQSLPNSFSTKLQAASTATATTASPNAALQHTTIGGETTVDHMASSQFLIKAVGLLGGLAFFLSQALKPMQTNYVQTRPAMAPLSTLTEQEPLVAPTPPITRRVSLLEDVNQLIKTLLRTTRPTPEQIDEWNKNPKVILSKKLWKTILVTVLQTGFYLLQKWKLNNSPKYFQHTGANDLPF